MAIKCCRGCIAPKRHPGCHDHCPEYIAEKAEYEARKAVLDRQKEIGGNLASQRLDGINRANKRKMKGGSKHGQE